MNEYAIVDVEFITLVEDLGGGWGLWEADAVLEDGGSVHGLIQGDGFTFAAETFEREEE